MSIIAAAMAGGLAGAGGAGEKVGLKAIDAEVQTARDEAMAKREIALQQMRDQAQVNLEQNVKQPHDIAMQENRFTNEGKLQDKRIDSDKSMQDTRLEAAAKERVLDRAQQSGEGDKNRVVQREGQAIHAQQVGIMAKGAELDREIKTIELKNKKDLDGMRAAYATEQDPTKRAQLVENIQILTGKDNDSYLPVPLKDADGSVTGYQIFDKKRGAFVDQKPGAAPYSDGTKLKGKDGQMYIVQDGKPVLEAQSRKPAADEKPAPAAGTSDGSKTPGQAFRSAVANSFDPNKAIGGIIGSRIIPPEESYTAP